MPWAGYERPIAPRLTELEKTSVSYTHAYAVSSYTSMSLGGLLAGRYPSELKRDGYFFGSYAKENLFFPELLARAGVSTLSAHAHGYFKGSGFDQGFASYEIVPGLKWNNTTDENVTGTLHEALAEKLLASPFRAASQPGATDLADAGILPLPATGGQPRFFAWFHFLDPHDQYKPHDADGIPSFGPKLRDKYDAEVLYTDRIVGKLLDFVATREWAKRTIIVVTADHGEAFGEHNQYNHGFELWENLVRVPLFFVVPGGAPRRIDTPRSAIDLAPTFLALLGVEKDAAMRGTSLVPELTGGPAADRDVVLDLPMTSDNDKRRGIVRGTKKLIAFHDDATFKYFDLAADPGEDKPILKGPEFDEMAGAYRELVKTIQEVPTTGCREGCLNRAYAK